jgi:hypothetical protein
MDYDNEKPALDHRRVTRPRRAPVYANISLEFLGASNPSSALVASWQRQMFASSMTI